MQGKVEAILLDVYDTCMVQNASVLVRPFDQMLTGLGFVDSREQMEKDREMLIETRIGLEDYLRYHAPRNLPEFRFKELLQEAQDNLVYHLRCYGPRADFGAFYQQATKYGLTVGMGSNLSEPYTHAVCEMFPQVEHKFFSCEIAAAKPAKRFFEICCHEMRVKPENTVMIGNSLKSDIIGSRDAGFLASLWLPEKGKKYTAQQFAENNGIKNLTEAFPKLREMGLALR